MKPNCFAVIIAGGKGTRFWPLSRALRPKQLLKILGPNSLISETARRLRSLGGPKRTLVVTVADQVAALRKELPSIPGENFIVEPQGNNTAPCIALAALEVLSRDPAAVMVVLPADHWIKDTAAFCRTLKTAVDLARSGEWLITIGVPPAYPETGYGYIVKGERIRTTGRARAYRVKRFKEKPSEAEARRLIRRGSLWNSGIFVWKPSTVLQLLDRYQPAISSHLEKIRQAGVAGLAQPSPRLQNVLKRAYRAMPSISIDHAVLEKAGSEGKVLTIEGNFGWSDVGSWGAVHHMLPHDPDGNAGTGSWLSFGAKNSLVHGGERLVVLLGVEDALVVDTPDALLIGNLKQSQAVRELVERLKSRGYGAYTVK